MRESAVLDGLGLRFAPQFAAKVKPGFGPEELSPQELLAAIASYSGYGIPRPQRYEDFARKFGTVVWVYRAVSINAHNVASVPFKVERQTLVKGEESWVEAPSSPMAQLLSRVNHLMTRYDLWEITSANLDLVGNAYWLLFPDAAGTPVEIWPLRPDRVELIPDPKTGVWGYRYAVSSRVFEFERRWVIHLRQYSPWHDFYGQGALSPVWAETETHEAATRYRRAFYANSGRPDGVLSTDQKLTKPQLEVLREIWHESHGGPDRAHRISVLHSGLKYQIVAASMKDADVVRDREMTRQDILAGFGVPLAAAGIEIGDVGRREEQIRAYREGTIVPRLVRVEETVNEFLAPHFGPGVRGRFDTTAYLKEDELRRSQIDVAEVNAGIVVVNEVRKRRGLPPLEGGDEPKQPAPSPFTLGYDPVRGALPPVRDEDRTWRPVTDTIARRVRRLEEQIEDFESALSGNGHGMPR